MTEIIDDVIGIRYRFKIRLMTAIAFGRNIGISSRMTVDTVDSGMRAFQWEQCGCMIKLGWGKCAHTVAIQTFVTEIIGDVIGVRNGFKVRLMAAETFSRNVGISC